MKALLELLGLGGRIVEAKVALKEAQIKAKAEATLKVLDADSGWEHMAAQNAASGWADEYWTAILSVPLILAFLGYGDVIESGFASLENVPPWYTWAVLASVSFAFARKKIPDFATWVFKRR